MAFSCSNQRHRETFDIFVLIELKRQNEFQLYFFNIFIGVKNMLRLQTSVSFPSEALMNIWQIQSKIDISNSDISNSAKFEASIWINNIFWLLSRTIIWRWILFYKSKLPEVQIRKTWWNIGKISIYRNSNETATEPHFRQFNNDQYCTCRLK